MPADTNDPRKHLERFIRWVMRDVTYLATYVCTVERQHDDGSLDLLPDDERVRGMGLSGIPVKHGLPGVDVRAVTGSRVLLGFVNGDPRQPYAALWSASSIESITIGGAGAAPAARQGDAVEVLLPPAIFSGTIGGVPASGVLTFPLVKTMGVITAGSGKVGIAT
jgi:hypothetical protein